MRYLILAIVIFISSCNTGSLKNIKVFKANSTEECIKWKKVEQEIIIYANTSEFDNYWCLSSEDLKEVYMALKNCKVKNSD